MHTPHPPILMKHVEEFYGDLVYKLKKIVGSKLKKINGHLLEMEFKI